MSQGGVSVALCWHATRAGKNNWISPRPLVSSNTSMSDAVGQPPPGKRASSALRPVDQTGRDGRKPAEASFNFQTRASAKISASDGASRSIHIFTATKHTHHDPFDDHGLFFEIDPDGFEIGVLG